MMINKTDRQRWLRIEEAAEYAGVTVFFMRELIRKRVIAPIPMGKRFLVDRLDLDAYIESLKGGNGNGRKP